MTAKEATGLYIRAGLTPPPDIAAPAVEHIRGTRRKVLDGIPFRSTLETDAYQLLKSWLAAGAITALELQPKFLLQPRFRRGGPVDGEWVRAITYRADFAFVRDGRKYVIEAKGFRTQPYILRRKLFLCRYPDVVFEEWTRGIVSDLLRR